MTTAQVVETSVTVNDNSPIQDYVNPDDQTQPTFEMTPGFKHFTVLSYKYLLLLIIYRSKRKKAGKSREKGEVTMKGCFQLI